MAGKAGGKRLVIVESPTKATKIASFLGDGYIVESSRGHVRDLPTGAADVPAKYKGEKWARTGVNVDNGFEALYVVNPDKKATMRSLKDALAGADELLLATDGDREGEAIAWHLLQELKPKIAEPARQCGHWKSGSIPSCSAGLVSTRTGFCGIELAWDRITRDASLQNR